jgi:hypothetical protein
MDARFNLHDSPVAAKFVKYLLSSSPRWWRSSPSSTPGTA